MEKEADSFIDIIQNRGTVGPGWCVYVIVFRQVKVPSTQPMGYFHLLGVFDEEKKALDYVQKVMKTNPASRLIVKSTSEPISIVRDYTKDHCISLSKEEWEKVKLTSEEEVRNRKKESGKRTRVEDSITRERSSENDPESIEYLRSNFSGTVMLDVLVESKKEGLIKAEKALSDRKFKCKSFLESSNNEKDKLEELKNIYETRLPERGEEKQMEAFLEKIKDIDENGRPKILSE